MKSIKQIALTVLITIGAFSAITYTSCNKDACSGVTCNNGGTCTNGTCTCQTGYEGLNCEKLVREDFIGSYTGMDVCGTSTYNIDISLRDASTNNIDVLINNLGGFGTNYNSTGTVTGPNTITITGAQLGGNNRVLSGTMTFTGTTMLFQYTVSDNSSSTTCTGNYSKQ